MQLGQETRPCSTKVLLALHILQTTNVYCLHGTLELHAYFQRIPEYFFVGYAEYYKPHVSIPRIPEYLPMLDEQETYNDMHTFEA